MIVDIPDDALQERLGRLGALTEGWDGEGSVAPSTEAITTLGLAARSLSDEVRQHLGASPHADGYIAVTIETVKDTRFADIYGDHIDYEIYPSSDSPWMGELDPDELRAFLAS
jgi:hypothetical protein